MKSNNTGRTYELYEGDHLVMSGKVHDITEMLSISSNNFFRCLSKNRPVFGKYTIKVITDFKRVEEAKKYERRFDIPPSSYTKRGYYEYLISHIRQYGNTIARRNPEQFREWFKEDGYDISYRVISDKDFLYGDDDVILPKKYRKTRRSKLYIITGKPIDIKEEKENV